MSGPGVAGGPIARRAAGGTAGDASAIRRCKARSSRHTRRAGTLVGCWRGDASAPDPRRAPTRPGVRSSHCDPSASPGPCAEMVHVQANVGCVSGHASMPSPWGAARAPVGRTCVPGGLSPSPCQGCMLVRCRWRSTAWTRFWNGDSGLIEGGEKCTRCEGCAGGAPSLSRHSLQSGVGSSAGGAPACRLQAFSLEFRHHALPCHHAHPTDITCPHRRRVRWSLDRWARRLAMTAGEGRVSLATCHGPRGADLVAASLPTRCTQW